MTRIRRFYALVIVFVLAIASAVPTFAQQPNNVRMPEEALRRDAEEYASAYGASIDEALRRFELMRAEPDLETNLMENESSTFAGLWIEHLPQFRIVVAFTRAGEKTIRPYIENSLLADIIEVRNARYPYTKLKADQEKVIRSLRKKSIAADTNLNVHENRTEVYMTNQAQIDEVQRSADIDLPTTVKIIKVQHLSTSTADAYAGRSLTSCTTGFSVQNSSGTRYVTTAAHCNNTQALEGTDLPYVNGSLSGPADVQWHSRQSFTVRNWAADGNLTNDGTPGYRIINATKSRDNQRLGETVCKYGKTTGYSCGEILSKNYSPTYVESATSTFIQVRRSGVNICEGGDSGGPFYSGSTAYGLTSGQPGSTPDDCLYMPINYISNFGLSVVTN